MSDCPIYRHPPPQWTVRIALIQWWETIFQSSLYNSKYSVELSSMYKSCLALSTQVQIVLGSSRCFLSIPSVSSMFWTTPVSSRLFWHVQWCSRALVCLLDPSTLFQHSVLFLLCAPVLVPSARPCSCACPSERPCHFGAHAYALGHCCVHTSAPAHCCARGYCFAPISTQFGCQLMRGVTPSLA